jgi:hypothetical protein
VYKILIKFMNILMVNNLYDIEIISDLTSKYLGSLKQCLDILNQAFLTLIFIQIFNRSIKYIYIL